MRKEDIKNNVAGIAKTTGKLLKTGYNTLSDKAEHDRQMAVIANMNQQAAAAKATAMVNFPMSLTARQRKAVDPNGVYDSVPGQMSINLETFQEDFISKHNVSRIKANGGQDYQALLKDVMQEHVIEACIPYLEIRKSLYNLWVVKAAPNADLKSPEEPVVISSSLEFRYGLQMAQATIDNYVKPVLKQLWNTDVALIMYIRSCGFRYFDVTFSNSILAILLK